MKADKMVVIYESGVPTAILTRAFNIVVISEVNAESYMEFDIYFTDEKRRYVNNQVEVHIDGQVYKIKTVKDKKEHGQPKVTHVYAENIYYDLARASKLSNTVFDKVKAKTTLDFALQNTEWNVGQIEINAARSFESECKNPLELLQLIADVYNGELVFDSLAKTVSLVKQTGTDNGMVFHYKKNMKSIERVIVLRALSQGFMLREQMD